MRSLYEITQDVMDILRGWDDALEVEDCDQSAAMIEALEEKLQGAEGEFDQKAENYGKAIRNLEQERDHHLALAAPFETEAEKHKARAKSKEHQIAWLKANLLLSMQKLDLKKAGGVEVKIYRAKNSMPSVEITDEERVPDRFVKIEKKILRREVVAEFRQKGETIPGVYIEQREHLRVK